MIIENKKLTRKTLGATQIEGKPKKLTTKEEGTPKPKITAKKIATPKPKITAKKIATPKPKITAKKLATPKPTGTSKKVATPKPTGTSKKVATPKTIVTSKKVATSKPIPSNKVANPKTIDTSKKVAKPKTVVAAVKSAKTIGTSKKVATPKPKIKAKKGLAKSPKTNRGGSWFTKDPMSKATLDDLHEYNSMSAFYLNKRFEDKFEDKPKLNDSDIVDILRGAPPISVKHEEINQNFTKFKQTFYSVQYIHDELRDWFIGMGKVKPEQIGGNQHIEFLQQNVLDRQTEFDQAELAYKSPNPNRYSEYNLGKDKDNKENALETANQLLDKAIKDHNDILQSHERVLKTHPWRHMERINYMRLTDFERERTPEEEKVAYAAYHKVDPQSAEIDKENYEMHIKRKKLENGIQTAHAAKKFAEIGNQGQARTKRFGLF